jgi:quercetin dioxygenase-like cupin family protein
MFTAHKIAQSAKGTAMISQPDSASAKEILPGIRMRTLVVGEHSMMCVFYLQQGAVIPLHQHAQEQTGYLVSGRIRLIDAHGATEVVPGSAWSFKGNAPHRAEILEDSVAIEVFTPIREDYLAYL